MAGDATGIREYNGGAVQSALVAGIAAGTLSFSITPTTKWPTGAVGKFTIVIDEGLSSEESILCDSLSGGVITVNSLGRGYDGTTAVSHAVGAIVKHTPVALDFTEANYIANTHNQTAKTTPTGADEVSLFDSAATFGLKKLTLTNLAAWLASLAQTLTNKIIVNPVMALGLSTQATANSTKTLTITDAYFQEFTGSTAGQIVRLPVVATLTTSMAWLISNKSTQTIAVNSSGSNLIFTVPAATDWLFTFNGTAGTGAASWSNSYAGASAVPGGGWTPVTNGNLTGSTTSATGLSGYSRYIVVLEGATGSGGTQFQLTFNSDTTAGHYYYNNSSTGLANIQLGVLGASAVSLSFIVEGDANSMKYVNYANQAGNGFGGTWNQLTAITSMQFAMGTWSAGTYKIYGKA